MVYVKKITVDNYDEFLQMALNQKFTILITVLTIAGTLVAILENDRKENK